MKFVMVIANEEYQIQIEELFRYLQCSATMIASTGDFLQYGEIIYLLGIEEAKAEALCTMCSQLFEEEQTTMEHVRIFEMPVNQFIKCGGGMDTHDREQTNSTELSPEESREYLDRIT